MIKAFNILVKLVPEIIMKITSRLYTDLSLMTSNHEIGEEINDVFNHLSLGETANESELLMVAPNCMINKIFNYIDEQIELAKRR